jgi:hypothetical protein
MVERWPRVLNIAKTLLDGNSSSFQFLIASLIVETDPLMD